MLSARRPEGTMAKPKTTVRFALRSFGENRLVIQKSAISKYRLLARGGL
ncbi:hypothetical protein [Brachyspira catarrhinii]|nr:hypothetical protein [Brachyspira catarrhinii]